jgi:hypothetical protein
MEVTGRRGLAFAASCAERLFPLVRLEADGRSVEGATASTLEGTWQIALTGAGPADELIPPLEELVKRELNTGAEPSFTTDAAVCLIYGLRAITATDPRPWAKYAGARALEVADAIVQWREDVALTRPRIQHPLRHDTLIVAELKKQERDHEILRGGALPEVVPRLRCESVALGERYAAEVTAIRQRSK